MDDSNMNYKKYALTLLSGCKKKLENVNRIILMSIIYFLVCGSFLFWRKMGIVLPRSNDYVNSLPKLTCDLLIFAKIFVIFGRFREVLRPWSYF